MKKKKSNNIRITLSLIGLCLPLFAKYSVTAENGCPYETYMRVDGKCLDISQEGLDNMTTNLDANSRKEVKREIKELNEEIEDLSEELNYLCIREKIESKSQIEMIENVCQY